jgi:hypothetical protein
MNPLVLSVDLLAAAKRPESLSSIDQSEIDRRVRDYHRFLELARRHRGPLPATKEIDEIWHLHMQHPRAYHRDCMVLFGEILDHDGGFGADEAELPVLVEAFEQTRVLWRDAFGEDYGAGSMTKCTRNCVSRCWHECSSKPASASHTDARCTDG